MQAKKIMKKKEINKLSEFVRMPEEARDYLKYYQENHLKEAIDKMILKYKDRESQEDANKRREIALRQINR